MIATIIKSKVNGNYQYHLSFKKELIKFIDDNQFTHIEYQVNNNQLSCRFIKDNEEIKFNPVTDNELVQSKITKLRIKNTEMSNVSYSYKVMLPVEMYILLMKIGYNIDSIQFKSNSYNKQLTTVNKETCFKYQDKFYYETEPRLKTVITNSNTYSLITNYKLI